MLTFISFAYILASYSSRAQRKNKRWYNLYDEWSLNSPFMDHKNDHQQLLNSLSYKKTILEISKNFEIFSLNMFEAHENHSFRIKIIKNIEIIQQLLDLFRLHDYFIDKEDPSLNDIQLTVEKISQSIVLVDKLAPKCILVKSMSQDIPDLWRVPNKKEFPVNSLEYTKLKNNLENISKLLPKLHLIIQRNIGKNDN